MLLRATFSYGEPLHGGELVGAGGVGDVEGAHCWRGDGGLAGDGLPVGVLDGGGVELPVGAVDEPTNHRGLAHTWAGG